MGKTSYKNTEALIKEISKKLNDLNNGNLSLDQLNTLVDDGKDLYEQLIILRYKAYDKYGDAVEKEVETPIIEEPVTEKEEIIKEEPPAIDFTGFTSEEEEEKTAPQPSFDFSIDEPIEETKQTDPVQKKEVSEPTEPAPAEKDKSKDDPENNSLNDVFKTEDEQSLRKKLQNSPVSDIKTHISIAKKFEYISNMFEGDSDAYNEAIDFLNTCATGNDARLKLNEYTSKYKWDLEDKSIIKFIELVERRYI